MIKNFVKLLTKAEPLRRGICDAGFAIDSVKIKLEQTFKLMSLNTEIKPIKLYDHGQASTRNPTHPFDCLLGG